MYAKHLQNRDLIRGFACSSAMKYLWASDSSLIVLHLTCELTEPGFKDAKCTFDREEAKLKCFSFSVSLFLQPEMDIFSSPHVILKVKHECQVALTLLKLFSNER